jgi:hypothetical protein
VYKVLNRKPYFDPYILEKVLEYTYLPSCAQEILYPWKFTYRQTFLFPGLREVFKKKLEEKREVIKDVVRMEMEYQLYECLEYIDPSEEDKQRWFAELREQFNLPPDYEFEFE